jgi:zinc transporter ZupT
MSIVLSPAALSATAIGLGVVAGSANVFGGLVITSPSWRRGFIRYFVAVGAGFMLATALLEVIPESLRLDPERAPLLLIVGFLLVHLVEHTFVAHFHFGEEVHAGEFSRPHVPYSVLTGLLIHTFFDGIAIGSGFLVSAWLGWLLFLAIFMHKIPEGLTVASVMLAAGESRRAAFLSAVMIGAASVAGVIVIEIIPFGVTIALPLAAGVTLYVAATDLLPEVNREPGVAMAAWVFAGAGLVFLLRLAFHGAGI